MAAKLKIDWKKLIISILITEGAGLAGSIFTVSQIPTWYVALVKSPITPPNWLFGPMWTILYLLMGLSLYIVWKKGIKSSQSKLSVSLFAIQLALNILWSVIFFGMHSLIGGVITIVFLWFFILGDIVETREVDKVAAYALLPYLAWVTIATLLNISILWFNP
ncbi:TspO/MBR family protein [Candidatus Tiddalikarchaeum anstoanum]|nr:TspO/MBR family protein [Candidatus Tiddalikarchaeum anstoanum]